ncbi:MAG: ferritin family protein [Thermodesulfobacteriota bacterium]
MGKLEFQQVLDMAIAEEMAAHCLYRELARKVVEEPVRDTLLFLAKEELSHRDLLVAYREGRLAGQGLGMAEPVDAHLVEAMGTPEWDPGWGLKELFLAAARKEQISHEFYAELAARHPTGAVRELLLRLAKEELGHKERMEYLYANTAFPQTDGG